MVLAAPCGRGHCGGSEAALSIGSKHLRGVRATNVLPMTTGVAPVSWRCRAREPHQGHQPRWCGWGGIDDPPNILLCGHDHRDCTDHTTMVPCVHLPTGA